MLEELASLIPPLPMPIQAARFYGDIRSELEKKGKTIGNNDLWIAAHALALDLMIVTNNMKEFSRVAHLKLENWTRPALKFRKNFSNHSPQLGSPSLIVVKFFGDLNESITRSI